MDEETLMGVKQVAAYLQINEATVYSWAQKGRLPGIEIGRIWRFRRHDIESWLHRNMRGLTDVRRVAPNKEPRDQSAPRAP